MINSEIDQLIKIIAKLPGLGSRSARRIVLHLLKHKDTEMINLSNELKQVAEKVKSCEICGNLDTMNICNICSDSKRDQSILCIVENVADLWALEKAAIFHGRYHVLGGTLSALDGIGPKELRVDKLVERASDALIKEVILANSVTVDGQTTAHYLADRLEDCQVLISKLAYGLPIGGELDFLDDGTIAQALKARSQI